MKPLSKTHKFYFCKVIERLKIHNDSLLSCIDHTVEFDLCYLLSHFWFSILLDKVSSDLIFTIRHDLKSGFYYLLSHKKEIDLYPVLSFALEYRKLNYSRELLKSGEHIAYVQIEYEKFIYLLDVFTNSNKPVDESERHLLDEIKEALINEEIKYFSTTFSTG